MSLPSKTSTCFYRKRSKTSLFNIDESAKLNFQKTLPTLNCDSSTGNENAIKDSEIAKLKTKYNLLFDNIDSISNTLTSQYGLKKTKEMMNTDKIKKSNKVKFEMGIYSLIKLIALK